MSVSQWLIGPFLDYGFMRRALAGASALSLGAAPLGVFLMLRRMSLMGDAMSHAILPGVALLDWATRLARQAFPVVGEFAGMDAVKFQHLVRPGTLLDVELSWQPAKQQLGFRFSSASGVHASGRLRFRTGQGA